MTASASLLCKYSGVKHGNDSKFTELEIEPNKLSFFMRKISGSSPKMTKNC